MREIHIKPVLNGFIVTVGCTPVLFTDIDTLCKELKRYQLNPAEVEKEYQNKAINKLNAGTVENPPTGMNELQECIERGVDTGPGRRQP